MNRWAIIGFCESFFCVPSVFALCLFTFFPLILRHPCWAQLQKSHQQRQGLHLSSSRRGTSRRLHSKRLNDWNVLFKVLSLWKSWWSHSRPLWIPEPRRSGRWPLNWVNLRPRRKRRKHQRPKQSQLLQEVCSQRLCCRMVKRKRHLRRTSTLSRAVVPRGNAFG